MGITGFLVCLQKEVGPCVSRVQKVRTCNPQCKGGHSALLRRG